MSAGYASGPMTHWERFIRADSLLSSTILINRRPLSMKMRDRYLTHGTLRPANDVPGAIGDARTKSHPGTVTDSVCRLSSLRSARTFCAPRLANDIE